MTLSDWQILRHRHAYDGCGMDSRVELCRDFPTEKDAELFLICIEDQQRRLEQCNGVVAGLKDAVGLDPHAHEDELVGAVIGLQREVERFRKDAS